MSMPFQHFVSLGATKRSELQMVSGILAKYPCEAIKFLISISNLLLRLASVLVDGRSRDARRGRALVGASDCVGGTLDLG